MLFRHMWPPLCSLTLCPDESGVVWQRKPAVTYKVAMNITISRCTSVMMNSQFHSYTSDQAKNQEKVVHAALQI